MPNTFTCSGDYCNYDISPPVIPQRPIPVIGPKCLITSSTDPTPKPFEFPIGYICFQYKYICALGDLSLKDSTCSGKRVGHMVMNYGATDSNSIAAMKKAYRVFRDLSVSGGL